MKARGVSGLGDRIREIAKRVGSISELARRAGLPNQTIQNYITRGSEPSVSALLALASAGNVSIEWLAAGESEEAGQITPLRTT